MARLIPRNSLSVRLKKPTAPPPPSSPPPPCSDAGSDASDKTVVPEKNHGALWQGKVTVQVRGNPTHSSHDVRQWVARQQQRGARKSLREDREESWGFEDEPEQEWNGFGDEPEQEGQVSPIGNGSDALKDGSDVSQIALIVGESNGAVKTYNSAFEQHVEAARRMDFSDDSDDDERDLRDVIDDDYDSDVDEYEYANSQSTFFLPQVTYRQYTYFGATKCMRARKLEEVLAATNKHANQYLDRALQPRYSTGARKGQIKPEMRWEITLVNALADLAAECPDSSRANKELIKLIKRRKRNKNSRSPTPTEREVWLVRDTVRDYKQKAASRSLIAS